MAEKTAPERPTLDDALATMRDARAMLAAVYAADAAQVELLNALGQFSNAIQQVERTKAQL